MHRMLQVFLFFIVATTPMLAFAEVDRQSDAYKAGYAVGRFAVHTLPFAGAAIVVLGAWLAYRFWSRRRRAMSDQ